jgi:hypothetical protein
VNGKSRNSLQAIAVAGLLGALALRLIFFPGSGRSGQDRALQEIKEAGGTVQVDDKAADRPVVRVDFDGLRKTGFMKFGPLGNDGLDHVRPSLEGLPHLRHLRITSMAMISDAGLVQLEGLTQLETLELHGGQITEAGLDRLRKKLPQVKIQHYP